MIGMKQCIHKERNYDNKRLPLTTKAKTYLTEAIDDRLRYISTITSQNQTLYVIFVHERSVGRINIENNYSATKARKKRTKLSLVPDYQTRLDGSSFIQALLASDIKHKLTFYLFFTCSSSQKNKATEQISKCYSLICTTKG